jgi:3-deoxy-D-manno-octulosonate 8-phosphate phosphatase (KDO 8-P phosphatase)
MEKSYKAYLNDITTFVFDVDGVLTDGSVLVTSEGELLRKMNVKDGYALKTAMKKGYNICIITGGNNPGVKLRLQGLGITDFYMNAHLKAEKLEEYLDINRIKSENVLYMGDDMPDIPAMKLVALPCCPQNAVPQVKEIAQYVSHKSGGDGCARDVIEQVLKVRGDWNDNFSAKND